MELCFHSHIRLCDTASKRMNNTVSSNVIIHKDAATSGVNVYSHDRMCLICSPARGAQHAITMTHTDTHTHTHKHIIRKARTRHLAQGTHITGNEVHHHHHHHHCRRSRRRSRCCHSDISTK